MPKEDAVREKAVRQWAALRELCLARVSNPKLGRGFFLMGWNELKLVAGGPDSTLEELEEFLRGNVPQPQKPAKPKRRMMRRYRL